MNIPRHQLFIEGASFIQVLTIVYNSSFNIIWVTSLSLSESLLSGASVWHGIEEHWVLSLTSEHCNWGLHQQWSVHIQLKQWPYQSACEQLHFGHRLTRAFLAALMNPSNAQCIQESSSQCGNHQNTKWFFLNYRFWFNNHKCFPPQWLIKC